MKKISIISPCYKERENVLICHQAVSKLFDGPLKGYVKEHIFADDFSDEVTLSHLRGISLSDPNVKIVYNARNYGVYRTTFNALKHATGDAIVPMLPVDLQDPPEFIPEMVKIWETGKPVVYGMRFHRDEAFIMKQCRRLYYILLHSVAQINIPKYAGEFQVIDRWVLDALLKHDDYYPFIRGMISNVCGDNYGVHYTWSKRKIGKTNHNLIQLYDQGINGIISFSVWPLRLMVAIGVIVSLCSFIFALVQIVVHFAQIGPRAPAGVATAITGLFFLCGLILFFMGITGEYIAAIHSQVRRGPLVVERPTTPIGSKIEV
jgi:polyisoprenyl-phosphate glycosyltransferase